MSLSVHVYKPMFTNTTA